MLVELGDAAGRSAWTVTSPDGRAFAVFRLDDGTVRVSDAACLTTDRHALGVHPVVEVDGRLHAQVGEPPPVLSWSERLRAHARDG